MKTLRSSRVAARAFSARSTFRRVVPRSTQCAAPARDPKFTILDGRAVVTQPGVVNILPRRCHVSAGALQVPLLRGAQARLQVQAAVGAGSKGRGPTAHGRRARRAARRSGATRSARVWEAAGQPSRSVVDTSIHAAAAGYSLVKREEGWHAPFTAALSGSGAEGDGGGMTLPCVHSMAACYLLVQQQTWCEVWHRAKPSETAHVGGCGARRSC